MSGVVELRAYVTAETIAAFREMLKMWRRCNRCGPPWVLPADCRCDRAQQEKWLDLDGIIYRHIQNRRPWELCRTVLPPGHLGDDVWTARAKERWRVLEEAVKAERGAA